MVKPAVIIIARHGARLDAADKGWHLTSPTPYDPPLTYGGWNQTKALGLRIAALLDAREQQIDAANGVSTESITEEQESAANGTAAQPTSRPRRRKHKILIHSSPFQRCLQTSVGISAGVSQYQSIPVSQRARSDSKAKTTRDMHSGSPKLHSTESNKSPSLGSIRKNLKKHGKYIKPTLRIDAFLGEWLSPDYFDMITPPPNSVMMLAGAKADLLRDSEHIPSFASTTTAVHKGSHGNLWGSGRDRAHSGSASDDSDGAAEKLKGLSITVPRRDRTSSASSAVSSHSSSAKAHPSHPSHLSKEYKPDASGGYTAPVPTYAVSPADPIPKGYVAHAKDSCVDIDYAWDSMREPLSWPDGGVYGEEWSAMHKRFRRGLSDMIQWYGEHGPYLQDDHEAVPASSQIEEDTDEDTDLVVVIVTHGAGCNALVAALTEQPVLLDVGMASLTMAVRKGGAAGAVVAQSPKPQPDNVHAQPSSIDSGFSNMYEMKLIASSEHLRPGADPARPSSPAPASPTVSAAQTKPDSRRRLGSLSHTMSGAPVESTWNLGEPRGGMNAALGSMRRGSAITIQPIRSASLSSASGRKASTDGSLPTTGLWTPVTASVPEQESVESESPNQAQSTVDSPTTATGSSSSHTEAHDFASSPTTTNAPSSAATQHQPDGEAAEADKLAELPQASSQVPPGLGRTLSQKGLWGSAPGGSMNARERGPKRRWTLQQD